MISKDTISASFGPSDYQLKLYNTIFLYSIPSYKDEIHASTNGYYILKKFVDKKFFKIIDQNTIRIPYIRYLYAQELSYRPNENFWVFPTTLNNAFNDKGYNSINTNDIILIKEFEIEYKKR